MKLSLPIFLTFSLLANTTYSLAAEPISYHGDLTGLLPKLREVDPSLQLSSKGTAVPIPIDIEMSNFDKRALLQEIGEQAGDAAHLSFAPKENRVKIKYLVGQPDNSKTAIQYHPDGSVSVAYGRTIPTLTCQALDSCLIQLEAGEKTLTVDLAPDKERWTVTPSMFGEGAKRALLFRITPLQPKLKSRLVVTTNRRIYSIIVQSPPDSSVSSQTRMYFNYN